MEYVTIWSRGLRYLLEQLQSQLTFATSKPILSTASHFRVSGVTLRLPSHGTTISTGWPIRDRLAAELDDHIATPPKLAAARDGRIVEKHGMDITTHLTGKAHWDHLA